MYLARTTIASLALLCGCIYQAQAQAFPRQTVHEKIVARACWARADARTGDIFAYPLRIGILDGSKNLGVYVLPDKWTTLSPVERTALMRNIACAYAGGRTDKRYWYTFSVADAAGRATPFLRRGRLKKFAS